MNDEPLGLVLELKVARSPSVTPPLYANWYT